MRLAVEGFLVHPLGLEYDRVGSPCPGPNPLPQLVRTPQHPGQMTRFRRLPDKNAFYMFFE